MEQTTIPSMKLNEENWAVWKFQTIVMMKGRELYKTLTGEIKKPESGTKEINDWERKDAKAQELIVSRMDQEPITHILSCDTANEMWEKLKSVYEKESVVSVHLLQQRFFSMDFGDGTVSMFISQIEDIKNKLKQAKEEISEKMIMTKVLMSLPDRFKHFRSAWESVPESNQTLKELTSRLLIEEERIRSSEENTTALTSVSAKGNGKRDKAGNMICHKCNKPGHIAKNCYSRKPKICTYCKKVGHEASSCWYKKGKEERNRKPKSDEYSNAFIGELSSQMKPKDWVMDSGASEHMCWDESLFSGMIVKESDKNVKVGNGNILEVRGKGRVELVAIVNNTSIKTTLVDVLYVPQLKFNLFSVSTALDKGYKITMNNEHCKILDKNGNTRALATRSGKLYKMNFKTCTETTIGEHKSSPNVAFPSRSKNNDVSDCQIVETVENVNIWHERLAHQGISHVKRILMDKNIKFRDNPKDAVCEHCFAGKQHRLKFERSGSRATELLEIIHADVCGPFSTTSLGGARFFLLLKDDFSSYRHVFFLKHKSEVRSNIEKFISLAERETNQKIKVLRTDNGTEFCNDYLKNVLERKGIRHQKSVVYTPEQNGRAEREMRTIVEAARSMIKNWNKNLWAEAVNTAVFVINRTGPSNTPNKTPFELWHKRQYDIKGLKIFGSKVSVHIPKSKRTKWDDKNTIGTFVGYDENVKGFRILFQDKKVEIHRDVIFLPQDTIENNIIEQTETYQEQLEEETVTEENGTEDIQSPDENVEVSAPRHYPQRNRRRPSYLDDYELDPDTVLLALCSDEDPKTYEEAMQSNESSKWKEAMDNEIKALEENETWSNVKSDSGDVKKVIQCKWVYRKKVDQQNEDVKYKARLVARGFQQTDLSDFDLYSPVAKLPSIRIFLAVCNHMNIPIFQLDVCSAFLYGDIKDDVYISIPKGFKERQGSIFKLRKSLYGLKNSPKNWNEKFHKTMVSLSFQRSESEYCLYVKSTENCKLFVLIYVDDLLIAGTDTGEVQHIKHTLSNFFKMKDLGLIRYFLGMDIIQDTENSQIKINQTNYLKNVLKKFDMQNCNPITTPMEINFQHDSLKRDNSETLEIESRCRKLIGCLMYAMLCSRPDLCITINILSRYQSCASNDLWKALKRVLRYIQGTLNYSLTYDRNDMTIIGYADADWAGDRLDRKSTSGYIFKINNCTVSWLSRKQSSVALSSTEAEYIALSLAVSEACWLKAILKDFKIINESQVIVIYEDNQAAIKVSKNPEFHKRLKHIDIRFHFVRDKIRQNIVHIEYIPSNEQLADIFTKPLSSIVFEKHRKNLGLERIYH